MVALGCPIKSQHYYGKLMQRIRTSKTALPGCKTSIFGSLLISKLKLNFSPTPGFPVVMFLKLQTFFSRLSHTHKESKDFRDALKTDGIHFSVLRTRKLSPAGKTHID